jgi:hypothetical protein
LDEETKQRIIEAHEVLVNQYGEEIQKGKELLKNLKAQKIFVS